LPKQGHLAFFYDSEQRTWGFDPKDRGSALVAYFSGPASSLIRTELPADVACSPKTGPEVMSRRAWGQAAFRKERRLTWAVAGS
jgi:hypothetical protein